MSNRPSRSTRTQVSYVDDDPMEGMESEEEEEEEVSKQGEGRKSKSSNKKRPAVTDSSASESEESEEEWGRKGKKKKAPAKKGRKKDKGEESEGPPKVDVEESSSGESGDDDDDEIPGRPKGVDFSKVLPFEIVAEIFSHLSPRDLLYFSRLSKSFHSILTSQSSRSIWTKARKEYDIPTVEDASETQLATLLFDKQCELCETGRVERCDFYLRRRCCMTCREANWVEVSRIPKLYPDFHPAVSQAVKTTLYGSQHTQWRSSKSYALYSDLARASETLEHLEIVDAAGQGGIDGQEDRDDEPSLPEASTSNGGRPKRRGAHKSYAETDIVTEEVQQKLKSARRAQRRSWYWGATAAASTVTRLESEIQNSFSPGAQRYLEEQKKKNAKWNTIATVLCSAESQAADRLLTDQRNAKNSSSGKALSRRAEIEQKLIKKKGFRPVDFQRKLWWTYELVNEPIELTDSEWHYIKKRVTRFAGKCAAEDIWIEALSKVKQNEKKQTAEKEKKRAKKKLKRLEAMKGDEDAGDDDEGGTQVTEDEDEDETDEAAGKWRSEVLKKPKKVSSRAWKYILPHLTELASHWTPAETAAAFPNDRTPAPLDPLTDVQRGVKTSYFLSKYRKIVDSYSTSFTSIPLFDRFLHLPSVKSLYFDNPFYGYRSNEKSELIKCDAIWAKKLDAILEEVDEYAIDLKFHCLKLILSNTTNLTQSQIDKLDIEILNSYKYDKDFFSYPSSWLICSQCGQFFGPLKSVLKHQHARHNSMSYCSPSLGPSSPHFFPLELSIEASCAVSAIFEVADVDIDTKNAHKLLDEPFEGKVLVWKNQPKYNGQKASKADKWEALVCKVHSIAKSTESSGDVLDAPIITLKNPSWRELRRLF